MKYLLLLVPIFIAVFTALASPSTLNTSLVAASASDTDVGALPPQPAGVSLSAFLDQLFPSNTTGNLSADANYTGAGNKRDTTLVTPVGTGPYTDSYGLHQSSWDEVTDSGTVTYNISADFSNCDTGLRFGSDIGVYTFTNGTTNNETDLRDMVADLYSLRYDLYSFRHVGQGPNLNYANHTAVNAQLALDEANQVLNNGLICQNDSNTALTPALDRTELRHLLANKHSYWTAVILSVAGGATVGATVAALSDLAFIGNVSVENVVQTAIVIGAVVFITGIVTRCDQVGRLDRAENVAERARQVVPQGREAIVQNVYIGWARRQLARIARRQVEEALSEAGITSATGGSGHGSEQTTPNSLGTVPGTPGSPASVCLSQAEAGEAVSAIELMSNANLNLEPIKEAVQQLGPRDEQGSCSSQQPGAGGT